MSTGHLERAVLETLTYSDIFDFPLRADELRRYLPVTVESEEVTAALTSLNGLVGRRGDYYFLSDREEIVEIRTKREARSKQLLPSALAYGRALGALPFVRMAALTGSLAVMNISKNADFDYLLVAAKGRVWTARAFALALNRVARLFGHTLCPNLIISETALEWPLHDLYSARELYQMIPITGMDMYHNLMSANPWAKDFLPNAKLERGSFPPHLRRRAASLQKPFEFALRGQLGDRFEHWEMIRKINRFSKQKGFGEETVFNSEVCQGNFHHHRKWTKEVFEENLKRIVIASPSEAGGEAIPSATWEIASLPAATRNDGMRL